MGMFPIVKNNPVLVKTSNCLIENLTEIDSLPHLRNLIEIPLLVDRMEGKGEVDDERKKFGGKGDGSEVDHTNVGFGSIPAVQNKGKTSRQSQIRSGRGGKPIAASNPLNTD